MQISLKEVAATQLSGCASANFKQPLGDKSEIPSTLVPTEVVPLSFLTKLDSLVAEHIIPIRVAAMATVTNVIALFVLALLSSAEASCALGPHADGEGRARAADPATYSDVCMDKLRDQGGAEFCKTSFIIAEDFSARYCLKP